MLSSHQNSKASLFLCKIETLAFKSWFKKKKSNDFLRLSSKQLLIKYLICARSKVKKNNNKRRFCFDEINSQGVPLPQRHQLKDTGTMVLECTYTGTIWTFGTAWTAEPCPQSLWFSRSGVQWKELYLQQVP